jgi:hypothetical protein
MQGARPGASWPLQPDSQGDRAQRPRVYGGAMRRAYEADAAAQAECRVSYAPEHNTDLLLYSAVLGGEAGAAEAWATKLRGYQDELPSSANGDDSREWCHLPLIRVRTRSEASRRAGNRGRVVGLSGLLCGAARGHGSGIQAERKERSLAASTWRAGWGGGLRHGGRRKKGICACACRPRLQNGPRSWRNRSRRRTRATIASGPVATSLRCWSTTTPARWRWPPRQAPPSRRVQSWRSSRWGRPASTGARRRRPPEPQAQLIRQSARFASGAWRRKRLRHVGANTRWPYCWSLNRVQMLYPACQTGQTVSN